MAQEILLTSNGSQRFNVVIEGANYVFLIAYNTRAGIWSATISSEGVELVSGVALVGGVDILKQFTFILKNLYMVDLNGTRLDATSENLGSDAKLFKLTTAEGDSLG